MTHRAEQTTRFILTGFTQNTGIRLFTFEGIGADQTRTGFTVRTDLALSRRYGIQMQELPLLCQRLLERQDEGTHTRAFTFTESEMVLHAHNCAAEREAHKTKRFMRKQVETASPVA
jgi:hypothetical protein